ncbi:MAG: Mur ligase family protein [bacterium]
MKEIFKKIVVTIITWEARLILKRYKPKVIAITGSVGKTSTKDAIFTVLSKFKTVRKSEKSFNSEIGIPLTILGVPNAWSSVYSWIMNILHGLLLIVFKRNYPEYLVLEVGAGKPGDIKNVAPWLAPDVVVITSFPDKPVHVEFFQSVEHIIEEKSALAQAIKADGTLVLNHDDDKVYALHGKTNCQTVSYGFHENATYHATHPTYLFKDVDGMTIPDGINFKLEYKGNTFPVHLPHVIAMHFAGQSLASIAVASSLGCDLLTSINAISEFKAPPGRLNPLEGINKSVIIDDTYNSSLIALMAAIGVLGEMKGNRRIAVLGDMLELGKFTDEAHREAGEKIVGVADILVTVGPRSRSIDSGAVSKGFPEANIHHFESSDSASDYLTRLVRQGDIVLLKGSQGVRLERAVEAIMAHPELKSELLCRQDKEWKNR